MGGVGGNFPLFIREDSQEDINKYIRNRLRLNPETLYCAVSVKHFFLANNMRVAKTALISFTCGGARRAAD